MLTSLSGQLSYVLEERSPALFIERVHCGLMRTDKQKDRYFILHLYRYHVHCLQNKYVTCMMSQKR